MSARCGCGHLWEHHVWQAGCCVGDCMCEATQPGEAERLTAHAPDELIAAHGYVLAQRYVDPAHGIDWAVVLWCCDECKTERFAPGPTRQDPPYCCWEPMQAVRGRPEAVS